jgi:hypothetical protein
MFRECAAKGERMFRSTKTKPVVLQVTLARDSKGVVIFTLICPLTGEISG